MSWTVSDAVASSTSLANPKHFVDTVWGFPLAYPDTDGYYSVDAVVMFESADQTIDGYFAAAYWDWKNYNGVGGYIGLQTSAGHSSPHVGSKIAVFSVWDTTTGAGPEYAQTFSGEGSGFSCRIAYPWVAYRQYRLRVRRTGISGLNTVWAASVTDLITNVETQVGTIQVPTSRGWIKNAVTTFHERYFGPVSQASDLKQSSVVITGVRVNNLLPVEPLTQANTKANISTTGVNALQSYQNIRDGLRTIVGGSLPSLKNLKSGFEVGAANTAITAENSSGTVVPESFSLNASRTAEFSLPPTTLDSTKWIPRYPWAPVEGSSNDGNNEMQWYNPNNVIVQDGICKIIAKAEPTVHVTQKFPSGKTYPWSSGIITTGPDFANNQPAKFGFLYGHVEARIKIPKGRGIWPAFWTLPTSTNWPPEIDILEVLGHAPTTLHINYHYAVNGVHKPSNFAYTSPVDLSLDYHVYGVEWSPNQIRWFLDGTLIRTFTDTANIPNVQMYVLLNLAVGGDWPGNPDGTTTFPQEMLIDWVKVWQTASSSSGERPIGQTSGNWAVKFRDDFTVTSVAPSTPVALPARTNLPNFNLLFDEDFNTNVAEGSFLSVYGSKINGHEAWGAYDTGWNDTAGKNLATNSGYDNNILSVQDSVLRMRLHTRADGRQVGAAPFPKLPGSVWCSLLYGRVEARLRCLNSKKGWKTAWLWWPDSEVWPRDGEIDWPEGTLQNVMIGNMHRQGATSGNDVDKWTTSVRYDTGWHTVVMEWKPNFCRFGVDGLWSPTYTSRVPNTKMHWVMQTETNSDSADPALRPQVGEQSILEVDYVSVWGYTP